MVVFFMEVDSMNKIFTDWVYGGLLAGCFLMLLFPLLTMGWPIYMKLCYLSLPTYMFHQYEEWNQDRFRVFINNHLGDGKNLLTHKAGFVINIFGVWGVIVIAMYLAYFVDPGYAAIAAFLLLINAFVHIAASFVLRVYNPGLITAVLMFLPLGLYLVRSINQANEEGMGYLVVGLIVAIAIHLSIVIYLLIRKRSIAS